MGKLTETDPPLQRKGYPCQRFIPGECAEEPDYPGRLVSTEVLDITIEQLASWLFGYSPPRGWQRGEQNGALLVRHMRVLDGMYLDEV